jgi:hypothetical protein
MTYTCSVGIASFIVSPITSYTHLHDGLLAELGDGDVVGDGAVVVHHAVVALHNA